MDSATTTPGLDGPVPFLDLDDLSSDLQALLRPRVERLGYLGDFFRAAGHQPDMLRPFVEFTEAAKGALDDDLVETVALTAATVTGSAYERHQHEQLAVRLGLGRSWVAEVERLDPDAADLSPSQRAVQRYALAALTDHARSAPPTLRALVESVGVAEAVAVMLLCGRYVAHAIVVNSCGIVPPVPSIFDDAEGA